MEEESYAIFEKRYRRKEEGLPPDAKPNTRKHRRNKPKKKEASVTYLRVLLLILIAAGLGVISAKYYVVQHHPTPHKKRRRGRKKRHSKRDKRKLKHRSFKDGREDPPTVHDTKSMDEDGASVAGKGKVLRFSDFESVPPSGILEDEATNEDSSACVDPYTFIIKHNVNIDGNDMHASNHRRAKSYTKCCKLCGRNIGCAGFTFQPSKKSGEGTCWLKSNSEQGKKPARQLGS